MQNTKNLRKTTYRLKENLHHSGSLFLCAQSFLLWLKHKNKNRTVFLKHCSLKELGPKHQKFYEWACLTPTGLTTLRARPTDWFWLFYFLHWLLWEVQPAQQNWLRQRAWHFVEIHYLSSDPMTNHCVYLQKTDNVSKKTNRHNYVQLLNKHVTCTDCFTEQKELLLISQNELIPPEPEGEFARTVGHKKGFRGLRNGEKGVLGRSLTTSRHNVKAQNAPETLRMTPVWHRQKREWQVKWGRQSGVRCWKADCPGEESGLSSRQWTATAHFLKQGVTILELHFRKTVLWPCRGWAGERETYPGRQWSLLPVTIILGANLK